ARVKAPQEDRTGQDCCRSGAQAQPGLVQAGHVRADDPRPAVDHRLLHLRRHPARAVLERIEHCRRLRHCDYRVPHDHALAL
ncbi:MAG: Cell division protein CrgA, partial [uncultured Arthrobacter sp.]